MALLEALCVLGWSRWLVVVTVDHGLREGSAAEAQRVVEHASRRGLAARLVTVSLGPGPGIEARARIERYAAIERVAKEVNAHLVLTGHTANDQAETVLFHLGRGASLAGARGVHHRRKLGVLELVRPLLGLSRAQTRAYVEAKGVPFVDDPMNMNPAFSRVRIRTEVVPALEQVTGPKTVFAISRFAKHAADDEAMLAQMADTALMRLMRSSGGLEQVGVSALAVPIARRVLVGWLKRQGISVDGELIDECRQAIHQGRTATLPGDRNLTCNNGEVTVEPAPARSR